MIDKAQVEKFKSENPGVKVHGLSAQGVEIAVRSPSRAAWTKFKGLGLDDKKRIRALEELVQDCLVSPTRAEFDKVLDEKPGLAQSFGGELVELAGATDDVEKKEL